MGLLGEIDVSSIIEIDNSLRFHSIISSLSFGAIGEFQVVGPSRSGAFVGDGNPHSFDEDDISIDVVLLLSRSCLINNQKEKF